MKTVAGNRDKWKDSVKALCATTGTKRIGVSEREIYRIEFQCKRDYKKRNARASRGQRIEWTCKDLLTPKKQKHGTR